MNVRRMFCSFVGLALLGLAPQVASAAEWGGLSISNPLKTDLHYEIRWGDGDWQPFCVYGGYNYKHRHAVNDYGRVPAPSIRFDYIGGDGKTTYRTYRLDVYGIDCPTQHGKRYAFTVSKCGCYYDLKAK